MTGYATGSIPLLPGIRSDYYDRLRRPHFRRPHSMEHLYDARMPNQVYEIRPLSSASNNLSLESRPHQTMPDTIKLFKSSMPPWLRHDDRVLRYFGYCIEKLADYSGGFVDRIRRVVIKFHLCDHTISILEPKTPNSGMLQGEFMKKHLVRKPNNAPFSVADFGIGKSLHIYGRDFWIVDCDAATRTYYERELSIELGPPQPYPQPELLPPPKQAGKMNGSAIDRRKAFWDYNDNYHKVLRFDVSWHDDHPLYPELRKYTLHYYLEDHTLEVVEPKTERNFTGRGHFALLISRQRVRNDGKGWSSPLSAQSSSDAMPFITEQDLVCGRTIRIHSRNFLLENCDDFTKKYYWNTFGIEQEKGDNGSEKEWENGHYVPKHISQMHNLPRRLYAQRDSSAALSSPFPDRDSHIVAFDDTFDKKILRFQAKFVPHAVHTKVDRTRQFILIYYMENDTLSIDEISESNTGLIGGRFLQRGRYKKCSKDMPAASLDQPTYFVAADFYVGAIISFMFTPYQSLKIIGTDDATLRFCESRPDIFPYSNAKSILASIRRRIGSSFQLNAMRQIFRKADSKNNGILPLDVARAILEKIEPFGNLVEQELVTLARFCLCLKNEASTTAKAEFLYDDFADMLASLALETNYPKRNDDTADPTKKLKAYPRLRSMFRQCDEHKQGVIPIAQAVETLRACQLDTEAVYAMLLPYTQDQLLSYPSFCDCVFCSYEASSHAVNDANFAKAKNLAR